QHHVHRALAHPGPVVPVVQLAEAVGVEPAQLAAAVTPPPDLVFQVPPTGVVSHELNLPQKAAGSTRPARWPAPRRRRGRFRHSISLGSWDSYPSTAPAAWQLTDQ